MDGFKNALKFTVKTQPEECMAETESPTKRITPKKRKELPEGVTAEALVITYPRLLRTYQKYRRCIQVCAVRLY